MTLFKTGIYGAPEIITAKAGGDDASTINPFGFMQENYDAMGRYRTTDTGKPVDASISVDFLDEGPLTPSSAASRRVETAANPSASTSTRAVSTIRSVLRRGLRGRAMAHIVGLRDRN